MIGSYTYQEILNLGGTITPEINEDGEAYHVIRKQSSTVNYYRKCNDGLWNNYDCRTIG